MTAKLHSDHGKAHYAMRKQTVEPVFGQIKDVRGARRFLRRVRRGVEAAVRHPQPAQAVAPRPPPTCTRAEHRLSKGNSGRTARADWLPQLLGPHDESNPDPISSPSGWLQPQDESFQQHAAEGCANSG